MIQRQGRWWHLRRRVPKRFQNVEERRSVSIALHTEDEAEATRKATAIWDDLVSTWELRTLGKSDDAERRYAAAMKLASVRGFQYRHADEIADGPLSDLLERVEVAADTPSEAPALLGAVPEPDLTLSRALDRFWQLSEDKTFGKSEDQVRRWRNPRVKAFRNMIDVIGDRPVAQITRNDMLDFRRWWMERIKAGKVSANSANKDLTHIASTLRLVNDQLRLGLDLPVGNLTIRETTTTERFPFSTSWIRDTLLAPTALDGLNIEARTIVLAMVNTGARPSELAALSSNTIYLDDNTPHISIEPEGRAIKTASSRRRIPLLGVSLEAMRSAPDGFPRYLKSSATLSGTVNKYLRDNKLMESAQHTLYGLRHAFEDRMLAAGIDERIRRDLMGHSLGGRQRYGQGACLEQMAEVLAPVAF